MNKDDASLQNLHDIVVPDAVSWWPLAPGWWALIVLVLALALVLAIRSLRRWRADAYRRAALRELGLADGPDTIAAILRRTALAIAPRETVAALHGPAWTRWLEESSPHPVPAELTRSLSEGLYGPGPCEVEPLRRFAADWIRHHSRPC